MTDGLRAKYLESMGYETQVLEFIDMEHTPKNILLRAVKKYEAEGNRADAGKKADKRKAVKAAEDIAKCEQFLQAELTLGRLLNNKGE